MNNFIVSLVKKCVFDKETTAEKECIKFNERGELSRNTMTVYT